jgi:hypothetical protein
VSPAARNVLIVVLIAAAVWAIPGGGTAADIVAGVIGAAFMVAIWLVCVYVYRNFRVTIFSLGDQYRGMLYGGLAAVLFLGASADKFFDEAYTTFIWFAILGAGAYALIATFRHWREYA